MIERRDLTELLERVEAATGPDRRLSEDIACLLGGYSIAREELGKRWFLYPGQNPAEAQFVSYLQTWTPDYASSLDAAVSLCKRVLPGWAWSARDWLDGDKPMAQVFGPFVYSANAATPSLALCAAIIRAYIEESKAGHGKSLALRIQATPQIEALPER